MKTKTWTLHVEPDKIVELLDPQNRGHNAYYAYVRVSDLPLDLPTDVNPRAQNLHSRVAREIGQGLVDESNVFHLLNRGLTITALGASYNPKKEELKLELAGSYYGLLDGGHSYAVIRKNIEPYLVPDEEDGKLPERPAFLDAYVRCEILTGVKSDLLVDIARSRNTSAQVKDESLANLEGSFDWLKDILNKTEFGPLIAYRENEDDSKYPIDIREVVALLTLFHPKFAEVEHPPVMGYTSKARCLELFRTEEDGYKMLRPIVGDILKLYDYIHLHFADLYKGIGGFGSLSEDDTKKKQRGIKLAKVIGVKQIKQGFPLYYMGEKTQYKFPDGWLYPMVAALRSVVSYKTVARWKVDPFKFFDKIGKSLVKMTLETSISLGRNPNAVGKSGPHWMQLHERAMNSYLRLLNVDTDQDVKL